MTFFINHDPKRDRENGQFFVCLAEISGEAQPAYQNRLGYWCDKGHLRHMAHAVLSHFGFGYDAVGRLLDDGPPPAPEKPVAWAYAALTADGCVVDYRWDSPGTTECSASIADWLARGLRVERLPRSRATADFAAHLSHRHGEPF